MHIYKEAKLMRLELEKSRDAGLKIGFVPTMGALHNGHISLINRSKQENDITVCSIFINPTQFNNLEDFDKYPKTIDEDLRLLEASGCDFVFLPSVDEVYPSNFQKKHYELGHLEDILEGKHRPGHFQGVCLVVERLIEMVYCDKLYLGKKDYQQCMVIAKLLQLIQSKTQLVICDTVREENGLAMSSRNMRLNESQKKLSLIIHQCLTNIKTEISSKTISYLEKEATQKLIDAGFEVDYVAITDINLNKKETWNKEEPLVALIAAAINGIRLIDNMMLNEAPLLTQETTL